MALNAIIASTSQDKGAAKLSAIYDKTNNGDNDKDPLNYYGYAQGEYASRLGETKTTTLRPGFSSLLDRTSLPDLTTTIQAAKYDAAYNALKTAIANVQYKVVSSFEGDDLDLSDDTTPTTVVKKTAAKKVTLTIKKGKGFKIKATKKNTTKKITYKSSNKKAVKVSASGKVTVLKYAKKKVTITVKVGTVKKTFSVKVIK